MDALLTIYIYHFFENYRMYIHPAVWCGPAPDWINTRPIIYDWLRFQKMLPWRSLLFCFLIFPLLKMNYEVPPLPPLPHPKRCIKFNELFQRIKIAIYIWNSCRLLIKYSLDLFFLKKIDYSKTWQNILLLSSQLIKHRLTWYKI